MTITGSQRIVVSGLGLVPAATARTDPRRVLERRHVPGLQPRRRRGRRRRRDGHRRHAPRASSIVDSTFLHCSSPYCIRTFSPDVLIQHNTFDDLDDSDAVHGFGGGVIRANHMDHALPHGGGNHNDFIQIGAGGPWTIDGNWFGVRTGGAASIWLDPINGGLIHDAVIENNVVTGHFAGQYVGIFVGGDGTPAELLPRNITVINNTVISGLSNSLRFGRAYATLPRRRAAAGRQQHGRAAARHVRPHPQRAQRLRRSGQACTATDVIGNPHLDANGAPTAASTLLIDHGDPSVAPVNDFFGFARTVGVPDIGAIEFGASAAAPAPVKVHAAARFESVRVARGLHRIVVRVRASNATRVVATVTRNGRVVAKAAHSGSARKAVKLTLMTPRRGTLVVRVRALGLGHDALRVVTRKARP